MADFESSVCISSVTATVLSLAGMDVPKEFDAQNSIIMSLADKKLRGEKIDRAIIYNPDAVALWLYTKYTEMFTDAAICSDLALPMRSVMPSVTPVCFASMYSGVMPQVHGIRKYEKPVLKVDTLFDLFIKAGKKAAIVSTSGDSISRIFLERDMEYFIYDNVEAVNAKALELIAEDRFDLIVIYNENYDSVMHKTGPESPEALDALKSNLEYYTGLVSEVKEKWSMHNVFYGFCPDHGCHEIDGGSGSHGLDMQEDMNVIHFYGIEPKKSCGKEKR